MDGYQDVPVYMLGEKTARPEDGNLPVNLLCPDGAYALQYNDVIYYIQDGDIYTMAADGTDIELFIGGENASGLCAYNGWLYYTSGTDIVQINVYTGESNVTYASSSIRFPMSQTFFGRCVLQSRAFCPVRSSSTVFII